MTRSTISYSQISLPARDVRTLQWCGEQLVDAAAGVRYALDGSSAVFGDRLEPSFDGAVVCGSYTVVFERLGTRAQLLRDGRLVRTLSRDEYCAYAYEYPACLWQTRRGRTLLAHCPERYNQVEIEDAETGRRLTACESRAPEDFFHSRLQVNPSGTHLLSAGWVWQPWSMAGFIELAAALEHPCTLDSFTKFLRPDSLHWAEEDEACWQSDRRVILASNEALDDGGAPPEDKLCLRPKGIAVFDVHERRFVSSVVLGYASGGLMAVGDDKALTLFSHPRLVSLATGEVLHAWTDLPSGEQTCSITHHIERPPATALDPAQQRFAVARGEEIVVVQVHKS